MPLSRRNAALGGALIIMPLAGGCAGPVSTLDPAGPQAQFMADLGWLMFAISIGVMVLVLALMGWAVWRGRHERDDESAPIDPMKLVVGGGIVLPLVVLPIVWVISLQGMAMLAGPPTPPALEIDITGRQFSYHVAYQEQGIELTDEVRIPAGQPVLLRLHSDDVIHSFWVPRLGGKMDLMPGQVNETWLEASQPGTYEGRCAEFCGIGHTHMRLQVVAMEPGDFEAWLAGDR